MSTKVVTKTFVKQFVALIKGDEAEATAAKVQRKAVSSLEARLAALDAHVVDAEQEVEEAEENLVNVRLNHGKQIGDRETYVDALLAAHNRVENSKTKLMNLEHTIETLKAELTAVSA
jgi:multidrug resistance efflux pump